MRDAHDRYERLFEYGEAHDFQGKLEVFRAKLAGNKADAIGKLKSKESRPSS